MNDCLYSLPPKRYNAVKKYYEARGEKSCCHCRRCNYHIRRISAKGLVPRRAYESGTFQSTLRLNAGVDHYEILMTRGEIERFTKELLSGGGKDD